MNSVKRGDLFEERSFEIITTALKEHRLGLHSNYCRVHRKHPYYSKLRENNIIFDLSIEVWPPNAERYHLLYLIECKDYSGSVPVNDIEEFVAKIQQVAGCNVKGVFITTGDIQEAGLKILQNLGFMYIKVFNDEPNIILHNTDKRKVVQEDLSVMNVQNDINKLSEIRNLYEHNNADKIDWDVAISNLLISELNSKVNWEQPGERAQGLEYLSKKLISNLTEKIINEFDCSILSLGKSFPINQFMKYLTKRFGLKFRTKRIFKKSQAHLNGYYDRENKIIHINPDICINQFAFVCAHEIAHFYLHENLKISQDNYEIQEDSKYDIKTRKHIFEKDKHWIEWQANYFASCLIMPQRSLLWQLVKWQESVGLSRRGYIWLDKQPCNVLDFLKAMAILGLTFEVSRSILEIRMADLGMIKYQHKKTYNNYHNKFNHVKSIIELLSSSEFGLNFENDEWY